MATRVPRCLGVATGVRHTRPGLKQREPGLFGLVLAISRAVVRTAVVACAGVLRMTPEPTVASRALLLGCASRESV